MKTKLVRTLAATATVALASSAAGCGHPDKQHFTAQSDRLCQEMNQKLRHASRPVNGNVDPAKLIARFAHERRAAREEFYGRFLGLDAPDHDARAVQEEFRAVVRLETALLSLAGKGDMTAAEAQKFGALPQTKQFVRAGRELNADMRAYGLSCAAQMRW
jgi:hypothetical protein